MRKVILTCGMSLDGYIARPDGSLDFLFMTKDVEKVMADFFATIDVVVFGRKTLDAVQKMTGGSYEPPVPAATYVFSRSEPSGDRDGVTFVRQSPAAFVRRLRKRRGKNICHMGGGELARAFLKADLIDELLLGVMPVLVGAGIPLFPAGFSQRDFKLLENHTDSRGGMSLRYRRVRPRAKRKK